jgi:hypothetical protein
VQNLPVCANARLRKFLEYHGVKMHFVVLLDGEVFEKISPFAQTWSFYRQILHLWFRKLISIKKNEFILFFRRSEPLFLWFSSPFRTFKNIIWRKSKWYIIGGLFLICFIIFLLLFLWAMPVSFYYLSFNFLFNSNFILVCYLVSSSTYTRVIVFIHIIIIKKIFD